MNPNLAGVLHLHPGAVPAITGGRPEAARLTIGRPADELPSLLGALFTLCSHAHRFTARRAVAAARGRDHEATQHEVESLRTATARDQVLRIAHDWPRQLGRIAQNEEAGVGLRSCPLWRGDWSDTERMAQLPDWLSHHWLGCAPRSWLSALEADPADGVATWCERAPGPVAALLRELQPLGQTCKAPGPAWQPLDDPRRSMPALAARLARREPVSTEPAVPDTGPWTRQRDPLRAPAHNAWMRLTSRLTDLLRLAVPEGSKWLSHGALTAGPGQGIAWTEMARGLLVHWVALDEAGSRVADVRVLAPTDLNFHPQGVLARALSALPSLRSEPAARLLAVAFDPCVDFDIVPVHDAAGASHA